MPAHKGKRRAVVDHETTPLLTSTSETDRDEAAKQPRRKAPILFTALVVLLSALLAFALLLTLLLVSFRPAQSELDSLPRTALLYQPPEFISVLNVTDQGVLVNVTLRCGIDADQALGVQRSSAAQRAIAAAKGERGGGAAWWETLRRWTASLALNQLSTAFIFVAIPDQITISPEKADSNSLVVVKLLDRLAIPLVSDVPPALPVDWLPLVSFLALAKPVATSDELWQFAQDSWMNKQAPVRLEIERAQASLPDGPWWARVANIERKDLQIGVDFPIDGLPGLPPPGAPLNLSSLVTLRHYSFETPLAPKGLAVSASATLPNFAPQLNLTIPFPLPFSISLPTPDDPVKGGERMALVVTEPIQLRRSSETIDLRISGFVTANFSVPTGTMSPLSVFIQNFMHGRDSPVSIHGLGTLPEFAPTTPSTPAWLLSSLPSLDVPWIFPGPHPKPKIIQSVTIEHMRISESAGKMKASGTVVAQVELPREMQTIVLEVVEVLPDVLIYDGPAPEDEEADASHPPDRAFGHINPEEFLLSTTSPSGDPQYPHRLVVTAPLSNVDLNVLPGRDGVLSDFVSKVIFKGGAQAGINGTASVMVVISGVEGRVRLDNLPVRGEFWVGKQRLTPV